MDIDSIIMRCILDLLRLDDQRAAEQMIVNRFEAWLR
jgi:hypothetical protein